MKEEIDENKQKEVIQKAYKYNIFLKKLSVRD